MRLTLKELKRASTDGYVIISRPDKDQGGWRIFAVRVIDAVKVGWERHVERRIDLAVAATSIQRDLDKFLGRGAKMSSAGRMRPAKKHIENESTSEFREQHTDSTLE